MVSHNVDGRGGLILFGLTAAWGLFCDPVWAGGAVAMQRQQQQQQMIMIQQQRAMQEAVMVRQQLLQQQAAQQGVRVHHTIQARALPAEQVGVQAVADLSSVVAALDRSGQDWALIIDSEAKAAVVEVYLSRFRESGVRIERPAWHYAGMIDSMSQQSPEMLQQPFGRVVQVVAILEYDFNNGQNPDALAYQILGSQQAVMDNRARLGH